MKNWILLILGLIPEIVFPAQGSGNTISKNNFDFALQSGYLYSRMDNGYFHQAGEWSFETGFFSYYTADIPLVQNSHWKERNLLQLPLGFRISPSNNIELQINSDLIAELPYKSGRSVDNSMGGNSPRFDTKVKLADESEWVPATALTVGVTFSSAKPFNIWYKYNNYQESNGLAGPGTGVADYIILFTLSKKVSRNSFLTGRLGLLPMGDPTVGDTSLNYMGSSQSDEIPYGLSWECDSLLGFTVKNEISGMYGVLKSTPLSHYSVFRTAWTKDFGHRHVTLDLEKGLTQYSDGWVAGFYLNFDFGRKQN